MKMVGSVAKKLKVVANMEFIRQVETTIFNDTFFIVVVLKKSCNILAILYDSETFKIFFGQN